MARNCGLACEMAGHNHKLVMSAAVSGAGVTNVFLAVIEHFNGIWIETGEPLAVQLFHAHYFGKTFR